MAYGCGKVWSCTALALGLFACLPLVHAGFASDATAGDSCKEKTLAYLKKRGYIPYNWVAATHSNGDEFVTEGEWSVDADEIKVACIVNKHGTDISGKYKILGIEILNDGKAANHPKNK